MEYFAGIDVSLERSNVRVADGAGKIVRETKVASEPEAPAAFFRGLESGVAGIGLETGPLSQWLHAGLAAAGFEVVPLETRHVNAALSASMICDLSGTAQPPYGAAFLDWRRVA
jgi:transposase